MAWLGGQVQVQVQPLLVLQEPRLVPLVQDPQSLLLLLLLQLQSEPLSLAGQWPSPSLGPQAAAALPAWASFRAPGSSSAVRVLVAQTQAG